MTQQRSVMTDEEHEKLVEVGNSFYIEFGELCAKHILMMPEDLKAIAICYLADRTSIYGSRATDIVDAKRRGEPK